VKSRAAKIVQNSRQSLGKMLANAGCTVVYGHARFVSAHEIQVGEELLRGGQIFINVGARAPTVAELIPTLLGSRQPAK
jgi:pyruvate/2-oxoglutarate dehydrogenase complex dihydrolipoamide dehydrogenase (E3) component